MNVQAAGDRPRIHHQKFEELSNEVQVTKACESVGFMGESPLECTTKRFTMWMMVLKVRQEHAENIHYLVKIQIPRSLYGSVNTPQLVQFFKSKSYVVLINAESKYRYRQRQETDPHLGLSYPEAQTATWKSYNRMIQITLQKVTNWRIIQASGNRTRYYQALRKLVGDSRNHNRF